MKTADIIFTIGNIFFILALFPSIFSENKPNAATSLITASILSIFSITYFSIDLMYSGSVTLIAAALWYLLFIQGLTKNGSNTT